MNKHPDIVIIGGGIIACSIAYFLASSESFNGSIAVIENTSFDAPKSTTDYSASIIQQFSMPENIRMSQYAQEFLQGITKHLGVDGLTLDVGYVERGSLFLYEERQLSMLYGCNAVQQGESVDVTLLDSDDLSRGFPWFNLTGLAGGSLGLSGEGWLNGQLLAQAFRKKAASLGVTFQKTEVTGLKMHNNRVVGINLTEGRQISCGQVVNAAGPAAALITEWAVCTLNVRPYKRTSFSFTCNTEIEKCPQVFDPSGISFRSDGQRFVASCSSPSDSDPKSMDFEIDYSLFEEHIWPVLAHRVPDFNFVQVKEADATIHTCNEYDRNPIVGPHTEVGNFYFAAGFSGREVQQAPAVGRAMSEIILYGEYRTLDLSRFSYERMVTGKVLSEHTVL
ncbi:MAG: FAD-binding oxidoreductase [Proteobacteria bacterium]|nr:FAD-binding oxidoreductase [Pseudomonadota bacterium]